MLHETNGKEIAFFIGDKEFKTEHQRLSVRTLLVDYGKHDPARIMLARKHGDKLVVFKDLDEVIHLENGMKFLVEKIEEEIVFFIDKAEFKTDEHHLTVRTILVDFAMENPTQTTLATKKGSELFKYTNLDECIHIENGMKFVVLHNGPTPVS